MNWELEIKLLRDRVRDLFKVLPYTHAQIAKKAGIGDSTLRLFLKGVKVNRITLVKIREFVLALQEENKINLDESH